MRYNVSEVITMEKTMTLNLRVNPTVKQQAEDVLKQLGIPMATAIDMYLRQITLTGGIPFSLSLPKVPAALNADTMTDDQLHAALQVGINEIQNDDTVDAVSAFAQFRGTAQMKQYDVKISHVALRDMEQIYSYIADRLLEPDTAMGQYNRIAEAIQSLNILPERCALVESEPERTQGLRQMLVDNYSVFYIVGEDTVSVARVLYSASDLVRRLRRMK